MRRLIVTLLCLAAAMGVAPAARAGETPTIPDAPTNVTGYAGPASATISWTAPLANGSPIEHYTVTSDDPTVLPVTVDASATSAEVDGLATDATYTFTVTATNALGDSAPSDPVTIVTDVHVIVDPVRPYLRVRALPSSVGHSARFRVRFGPTGFTGRLSFELSRVGGGFHQKWSRKYAAGQVYRSHRLARPGRYVGTVTFSGHRGQWSYGAGARVRFRVARR